MCRICDLGSEERPSRRLSYLPGGPLQNKNFIKEDRLNICAKLNSRRPPAAVEENGADLRVGVRDEAPGLLDGESIGGGSADIPTSFL